jgi:hypothetical protein
MSPIEKTGRSSPLGATVGGSGVNFSPFHEYLNGDAGAGRRQPPGGLDSADRLAARRVWRATWVELLLFDHPDAIASSVPVIGDSRRWSGLKHLGEHCEETPDPTPQSKERTL